jgi:hypothetical protein
METVGTPPEGAVEDAHAGWRDIPLERWYIEAAQANPHRCEHPGEPCGERFLCDREDHRQGGYPTAELLPNGKLLLHCEALVLTRNDPEYRERLDGLRSREEPGA